MSLISELRSLIESGQMMLHYQPIIEIETSRIVGVETLARWPGSSENHLAPETFVPMMEQTGLISPYTYWALDKTLSECASWKKQGIELNVSFNLSMYNLRETGFPAAAWSVAPEHSTKPSIAELFPTGRLIGARISSAKTCPSASSIATAFLFNRGIHPLTNRCASSNEIRAIFCSPVFRYH